MNAPICLNSQTLEEVESFTYLGGSIDKFGKACSEVDIQVEKGIERTNCSVRRCSIVKSK